MLVAVTVALLSEVTSGATYVPFAEIDPRLADQLTESFGVPVTVALKCCQSPDTRSTLLGDTDTSIRIVLGAGAANLVLRHRPSPAQKCSGMFMPKVRSGLSLVRPMPTVKFSVVSGETRTPVVPSAPSGVSTRSRP